MKELLTLIGLVAQLAASFLMAARSFTDAYVRAVPFVKCGWLVATLPGIVSTVVLVVLARANMWSHMRSHLLFGVSLIVAIAWVPALAKHSLRFLDRAGERRTDLEVQRLNAHGLALLAVGFVLSALGAVL